MIQTLISRGSLRTKLCSAVPDPQNTKPAQEPITRSLQLPHIPVTAFSQTDLFLVWIYLELESYGNLSNQLQSQARTNVDMSKWCRPVHVRPHCFILTEACSRRLELAYFAGTNSKNRLVCKNAVALAYYGSCRLLVMGSWPASFLRY